MEDKRKFSPIEFYRYVSEPIPKKDLDIWFKANDILQEKSELFFYFIKSLYVLVDKTYLGSDIIKDEEIKNHFSWCWTKVINDLKKENINFNDKGSHFEYFWNFFLESFYTNDSELIIDKVDKFFSTLFIINDPKTKSELDIYTDLYKTLDNNLIK